MSASITATKLKERMCAAVEREYPEQEGHLLEEERQGKIPEPIIQTLRAMEAEAQTGASGAQASSRIDAKETDAMSPPLRKRIQASGEKCHARRWRAQYRRVPYLHTPARRLSRTEQCRSFRSRYTPRSRLGACRGS